MNPRKAHRRLPPELDRRRALGEISGLAYGATYSQRVTGKSPGEIEERARKLAVAEGLIEPAPLEAARKTNDPTQCLAGGSMLTLEHPDLLASLAVRWRAQHPRSSAGNFVKNAANRVIDGLLCGPDESTKRMRCNVWRMISSMTGKSDGSTKPSAPSLAKPARPFDYSKLPEHMRERTRLNHEMKAREAEHCRKLGIKTL